MSADRTPRRWRDLRDRLALPLLDAVFPSNCFACGRRLGTRQRLGACTLCWAELQLLPTQTCPGCALPAEGRCVACVDRPRSYEAVRALYVYDDRARSFLLRAKLGRRPELLAPLGEQLACALEVTRWPRLAMSVVPVPSHPWTTLMRGFSPAVGLARPVADRLGLPLDRHLRRALASPRSSKRLSAVERRAASRRAVHCASRLDGTNVLLVDDVMTTGATLEACAAALRSAGASTVLAAVWARALDPGDV